MDINKFLSDYSKFFDFLISNIIPAIIILVVGWFLAGKLTIFIKRAMEKAKLDEGLIGFSCSILKVFFRVIVILVVIAKFGVNISSIIATLGATLVTVGLAIKDSLSNVASGILIIVNRPFKVGDSLEVDKISGTVSKIEMLFTTLITPDNKEITIPNSKLTSNFLINSSAKKTRRIDISYPVKNDVNIEQIINVLNKLIDNTENVLQDPKPVVAVGEYKEDRINILLKVWCKTENYNSVYSYIQENVKIELDKNNIKI